MNYSKMLKRLFWHFFPFGVCPLYKVPNQSISLWVGDLIFYIADVFLVTYVYSLLSPLFKKDMRWMDEEEICLCDNFYNRNINTWFVNIHPNMPSFIRKKAYAYVSLNTINYKNEISKSVFIHELAHVWQYQRYGSVYVFRALLAQNSDLCYDYGGLQGLYEAMIERKELVEFNFEQQAQILQDSYDYGINNNQIATSMNDGIYRYFYDQVHTAKNA